MPRLAGVEIPDNKQIKYSLRYIYGVGPARADKILAVVKIDPTRKASDLKAEELGQLRDAIEKEYKVEGDLRREVMNSVKRLRDIASWRGLRHQKRLPARGQRTKTNNRTVRGNVRKTVGSGKRPAASPT